MSTNEELDVKNGELCRAPAVEARGATGWFYAVFLLFFYCFSLFPAVFLLFLLFSCCFSAVFLLFLC